jgi:hypothetical protein
MELMVKAVQAHLCYISYSGSEIRRFFIAIAFEIIFVCAIRKMQAYQKGMKVNGTYQPLA